MRNYENMTPPEAIDALERMQAQVVHGSNLFSEIANVIKRLQLYAVANQVLREQISDMQREHQREIRDAIAEARWQQKEADEGRF